MNAYELKARWMSVSITLRTLTLGLTLAVASTASAGLLTFNIDPAQSTWVVQQKFTSGSTDYVSTEIYPGSSQTNVSGFFEASVDFNFGTISFNGVGQITPEDSNPQTPDFPLGGNVSTVFVADFGGGNQFVQAWRHQSFATLNPTNPSGPIQMAGTGSYSFSSPLLANGSQDVLQYGVTLTTPGNVVTPIWGHASGVLPITATDATLVQLDKWHWELRLPLSEGGTFPFNLNVFGHTDLQNTRLINSYLVATAAVPEVSTLTLLALSSFVMITGRFLVRKREPAM
jgi:hypothetical protein